MSPLQLDFNRNRWKFGHFGQTPSFPIQRDKPDIREGVQNLPSNHRWLQDEGTLSNKPINKYNKSNLLIRVGKVLSSINPAEPHSSRLFLAPRKFLLQYLYCSPTQSEKIIFKMMVKYFILTIIRSEKFL